MTTSEKRMEKGKAKLRELTGGESSTGRSPIEEIAGDLMQLTTEYLFGEIWCRPGLDTKSRSMCTMAALTVLGKLPQLRWHIGCALNLGITQEQITEILMQMAFYGGLPAALNALEVAKEVFDQRNNP